MYACCDSALRLVIEGIMVLLLIGPSRQIKDSRRSGCRPTPDGETNKTSLIEGGTCLDKKKRGRHAYSDEESIQTPAR